MKILPIPVLLSVTLIFVVIGAHAQESREDVVYLKNGKIYHGHIIEEVYNESITIRMPPGEKYKVAYSEISRIAKEPLAKPAIGESYDHLKKAKPEFHYPRKKFFFQGEVMIGYIDFGARMTGGYKFGRFGMLGLGVGVDAFSVGLSPNNLISDPFQGTYFPVYLYYSGDILKKRFTPFYSVEAGYAFRTSPSKNNSYISVTPLNHPVYDNLGGFAGGVGFGVKLYSWHKVYAAWSFGLDIKSAKDKYSNYYYNSIGEYISVSYSSFATFLMPAFKMDIGF